MSNLKYRVLLIVALVLASVWALFPRTVVERVKSRRPFVFDTVRRVPLKRGLDLQGGMYLAFEMDESKEAVADKSDALDRALKVVRTRIDEFGVAEARFRKSATTASSSSCPGIDDQERAVEIVQGQAFLQFQITDETQALEQRASAPRSDRTREGSPGAGRRRRPASAGAERAQDLFTQVRQRSDRRRRHDEARQRRQSRVSEQGGPFRELLHRGRSRRVLHRARGRPDDEHYLGCRRCRPRFPRESAPWSERHRLAGGEVFRALYSSTPGRSSPASTSRTPSRTSPDRRHRREFQLNNEGGRRFRNETGKHIQDYMAIVLDDRVMGRPPVIQARSARADRSRWARAARSGGAGPRARAARRFAAGSAAIAHVRTIGASLGEDCIRQGCRPAR